MIRRLVVLLVPGILTSLIASYLFQEWANLDDITRIAVSGMLGALTVALLVLVTRERESKPPATRVASHLESKDDVRIQDVDVTGASGDTEVASGVRSKQGGVAVKGVSVHRGTSKDETD